LRENRRRWVSLVCTLTVAASLAWAEDAPSSGAKQPPAAAPSAAPKATPEVTLLNTHEVEGALGREVRDPAIEDMGRIVDVLVKQGGEVRAAIIDFGGFLGVGSRKSPWTGMSCTFRLREKPKRISRSSLPATRSRPPPIVRRATRRRSRRAWNA